VVRGMGMYRQGCFQITSTRTPRDRKVFHPGTVPFWPKKISKIRAPFPQNPR